MAESNYTYIGYDNLLSRDSDRSLEYNLGSSASGQTGSSSASDQNNISTDAGGVGGGGAAAPAGANSGSGAVATNGSVQEVPVKSGGAMSDVTISSWIKSENWKPKKGGFYIDGQTGYAEFCNVFVSGNIQALTGNIGGFTIGANVLYGGTIQTSATVGIGSNGVVMDSAGLRGYSSTLGQVFNLPTDGSAPTFASGIINSTVFNINTNAVLQTSTTVGDGFASSAGILINSTGLYGCSAFQTLANANIKVLVNGTITVSGTINATAGYFGNITNGINVDSNGLNIVGTGYIRTGTSGARLEMKATSGTYQHTLIGYDAADQSIFRVSTNDGAQILIVSPTGNQSSALFQNNNNTNTVAVVIAEAVGRQNALTLKTAGSEARGSVAALRIWNDSDTGSGILFQNTDVSTYYSTDAWIKMLGYVPRGSNIFESTTNNNRDYGISHEARITGEKYLQFPAYYHCSDFDEYLSGGSTALASTVVAKSFWVGGGTAGTQTLTTGTNEDANTYITLDTTTTASRTSTLTYGRTLGTGTQQEVEFRLRLSSTTNTVVNIGMTDGTNYVYFKFDSSAANFTIDAYDGTLTSANSGFAPDTTAWHTFRLIVYSATVMKAWFDDALCTLPATHIPYSSHLKPYVFISNKAANESKKLYLDFVKIWTGRDDASDVA